MNLFSRFKPNNFIISGLLFGLFLMLHIDVRADQNQDEALPENISHYLKRCFVNLTQKNDYDSVVYYCNQGLSETDVYPLKYKAKLLRYKGMAFSKSRQYDSAFHFYEAAIKVNQEIKDHYYEAKNQISIGALYYKKEENYQAIEHYLKAYEIATANDNFKSATAAQNNIGASYSFMGEYLKASEHLLIALKIAQDNDLKFDEAQSLGNLATCYGKIGNYELSGSYYSKGKSIKEELKDTVGLINTLINLGYHFSKQDLKDSALFYYDQALDYAEIKGTMLQKSVINSNISTIYNYWGEIYKGLEYLEKAYEINKKINRQKGIITCDINLADSYIELGEFSKAKFHLDEALSLAQKNKLNQKILETYNCFASYYSAIDDYENAYQYKVSAYNLSDTVLNTDITEQMQELQVKYDTQQKENRIAELVNKQKITQLTAKNQRRNLFIVILLLISGIVIFLMLNRQKRLKSKELEATLNQRLLRSQMNPHFIFNALGSIQNFIFTNDSKKAGKYLSNFSGLMRDILDSSTVELIPLEQEVKIAENYLILQKMRKGDRFNFEIDSPENIDEYHIPPMFAQPFIENAVIHAFKDIDYSGKIKVTYAVNEPYFNIIVDDNGIGYNPEQQKNKKHKSMAMNLTHQRLELLKDKKVKPKIDIINKSEQGEKGTKILVAIPLEICLKF